MNQLLLLLTTLLAFPIGDDFLTRQKAGKIAEDSTEGRKYIQSLTPQIFSTVKKYKPGEQSSSERPKPFVFIAYVSPDGKIFDSKVDPVIPIAEHFLHNFTNLTLPKPPKSNTTPQGYPITIDFGVKFVK